MVSQQTFIHNFSCTQLSSKMVKPTNTATGYGVLAHDGSSTNQRSDFAHSYGSLDNAFAHNSTSTTDRYSYYCSPKIDLKKPKHFLFHFKFHNFQGGSDWIRINLMKLKLLFVKKLFIWTSKARTGHMKTIIINCRVSKLETFSKYLVISTIFTKFDIDKI